MSITLQKLDASQVACLESHQELRRVDRVWVQVSPETEDKLAKKDVAIIRGRVYECATQESLF